MTVAFTVRPNSKLACSSRLWVGGPGILILIAGSWNKFSVKSEFRTFKISPVGAVCLSGVGLFFRGLDRGTYCIAVG